MVRWCVARALSYVILLKLVGHRCVAGLDVLWRSASVCRCDANSVGGVSGVTHGAHGTRRQMDSLLVIAEALDLCRSVSLGWRV